MRQLATTIERFAAVGMVALAMGAITWLAIVMGNEQAQGALISVVSAGVGYFLRGKVETTNP